MAEETIVEKIDRVRDFIRKDPTNAGIEKANRVQGLAVLAMKEGMNGGGAWENYMREFTDDPVQLGRLTGNDEVYMEKPWGPLTLAYIVGNGVCTMTSIDTTRYLDAHMLAELDDFSEPEE